MDKATVSHLKTLLSKIGRARKITDYIWYVAMALGVGTLLICLMGVIK